MDQRIRTILQRSHTSLPNHQWLPHGVCGESYGKAAFPRTVRSAPPVKKVAAQEGGLLFLQKPDVMLQPIHLPFQGNELANNILPVFIVQPVGSVLVVHSGVKGLIRDIP